MRWQQLRFKGTCLLGITMRAGMGAGLGAFTGENIQDKVTGRNYKGGIGIHWVVTRAMAQVLTSLG